MKSFTISLVLLFISINFSQTNPVKQITDYEFNSGNPVILYTDVDIGEIFFEGNRDSAINIFSLKYDLNADAFYQLTQITSNNYINKKVIGSYIYIYDYVFKYYKIILWETNQNGNWDIAFSIDSGDGWTTPEFFFNYDEDESDPSFMFYPYYYSYNNDIYQIIYTKGNSVYFFKKDSVETEELFFEGNDTVAYSNAVITDSWTYSIAAAERRINRGEPYIVYRQKYYLDSSWSEIKEAFKRAPSVNPKFIFAEYSMALSFEVLFNGKRKVVWINLDDLGSSNTVHELLDDQSLETSDFSMVALPQVITKAKDFDDPYNPYSFRLIRNDSTFIRSGINNNWESSYADIYTKIGGSHSTIGILGYYNDLISYTIWEDSSDGRINLFGLKRIDPSGDVKKDIYAKGFSLSQNYPNPFNPNTKIHFAVSSSPSGTGRQFVTLKVFDILGREIATIVNEEKQKGEYEVEFNASTLSAGIYFYQLKAGNSILTKKMIYLK
jgi:hypothetical protein